MILDSSVILQVLLGQPLAHPCREKIDFSKAMIPTLCIFEVYRKLRTKLTEEEALSAMSAFHKVEKIELTEAVALTAADLSVEYKLAMADAIVLAHAQIKRVPLLTLDNDFSSIPGVIVIR